MSTMKVNMDALLLPDGSTFNSTVGTYSQNNTTLKKLRFIANSQVISETPLCTDADGTVGYLVANGEWLEIHTSANSFKANKDCSYMFGFDYNSGFQFFINVTEIDFGECFNTSNVENMSYMFSDCANLSSLDVSGFNTVSVNDMSSMFYYCPALTSLDVSNFKTGNVTNMSCMFRNCSNLNKLDIGNFETSNVVDMSNMFDCCSKLTSLDVSNFDTSNVTDMSLMFSNCSFLSLLDVSNFKTENVTNMSYMFYYCSALTSLDISKFNTSKVTNMMYMFNNCSTLTSLDVSHFNTEKVESFTGLFAGCSNLNVIDVSGFNTKKATAMSYMFSGCSKLKVIDVSGFNTTNVSGMGGMFNECSSLSSLDLSIFTFDEYPGVSDMLNLVGSTSESCPIPVNVTKEGYIYLTQITSNCKINANYAKFVNEDGSDCNYEEDARIYNSKTTATKPEIDEDNVYLIQSAANLKWFMENCEKSMYNSAHYKLTTDILSAGISWDPVWFCGIFDGGNHFIENLKFYGYDDLAYGFFSSMSGTVKNLILKNPSINQSGDNDSYGMNSGLLAATASGSIINCGIIGGSISISSTSKAWANGGGLVGRLQSGAVIKGCYVIGTKITGSHTRNGTYIGGLIGECSSGNMTIISCYTKSLMIKGNEGCDIGTFIGNSKYSTITLNTCFYDYSSNAIGSSYASGNMTTNIFEALTEVNFANAVSKMNLNLIDCDYIFDEDGYFVKRQQY